MQRTPPDLRKVENRSVNTGLYSAFYIISIVLFLAYQYFAVVRNLYIADLLSAVFTLACAIAVFIAVSAFERNQRYYLPLAMGLLAWGITDVFWFITRWMRNGNPETNFYLQLGYLLFNFAILISVIRYFTSRIRAWHRIQLYTDLITTLIVFLMLGFNMIDRNPQLLQMSRTDLVILFASLAIDLGILFLIIVMLANIKIANLLPSQVAYGASVMLFVLLDFIYLFQFVFSLYSDNSYVDQFYYSVFALFTFAITMEFYTQRGRSLDLDQQALQSFRSGTLLFWILPLVFIMAATKQLTGLMLIRVLVVSVIYYLVRQIVIISHRNEQFYLNEQKITKSLESTVQSRTLELVEANIELEKQAATDPLTGIYSRRYFYERLSQLIEEKTTPFSLLQIDILNFQMINNLHGNAIGDKVLIGLAQRSEKDEYKDLFVARMGGDEFGVIMFETDKEKVEEYALRIVKEIEEPLMIDDYTLQIKCNIGITQFPKDSDDLNTLFKYTSLALTRAKQLAWDKPYAFFSNELIEAVEFDIKLDFMLRGINPDTNFQLYYQPQFQISNRQLVGMGALIRWKHPELGFISPGRFIPIAENNGAIREISFWTLDTAAKQIAEWNSVWGLDMRMSVNFSPKLFNLSTMFAHAESVIKKYQIQPNWLAAELTEGSTMESAPFLDATTRLSAMGFSISIDDFGTGYSSMSYLVKYNASELKIAKELVDNIGSGSKELLIVKAITTVAKQLGLTTIAEGVEQQSQLDILNEIGCDRVQGYLTGRPVPKAEFEEKFLKPYIRNKYI